MKELSLVNSSRMALVDSDDYPRLAEFIWYLHSSGMAYRYTDDDNTKTLQGEVLHTAPKTVVAFWDRNPLNCQKENLWIPETSALSHARRSPENRTGYRGVFKAARRYGAKITKDGKTYYLGTKYTSAEAAAKAYDRAARKMYGPLAQTNFKEDV